MSPLFGFIDGTAVPAASVIERRYLTEAALESKAVGGREVFWL